MIHRLSDREIAMLVSLIDEPRMPSRTDVVAVALVRQKLARWNKDGELVISSEGLSMLAYLGKV